MCCGCCGVQRRRGAPDRDPEGVALVSEVHGEDLVLNRRRRAGSASPAWVRRIAEEVDEDAAAVCRHEGRPTANGDPPPNPTHPYKACPLFTHEV